MTSKAALGGSTRSTVDDEAFRNMDEGSKELYTTLECQNADMESWGNDITVSGKDDADADYEYDCQDEKISLKSGISGRTGGSREGSKKKQIHSQMLSYKQQGSYDIPEDVYAFITVAPVCSAPFIFACTVIGIKYIVYCTLLVKIVENFTKDEAEPIATAVKFVLIPVTVAMQEDLMAVYAGLANARYDPKVLDISPCATKSKFALAYLLQLIDGLLSLVVNFFVMLITPDVLDVFLQFAALHFLQDIDDVFYALVEKGFFGDGMEHMATVCKQVSWPRRAGTTKLSQFLTNLDTLLFAFTFFVCLIWYLIYTWKYVVMKDGQ